MLNFIGTILCYFNLINIEWIPAFILGQLVDCLDHFAPLQTIGHSNPALTTPPREDTIYSSLQTIGNYGFDKFIAWNKLFNFIIRIFNTLPPLILAALLEFPGSRIVLNEYSHFPLGCQATVHLCIVSMILKSCFSRDWLVKTHFKEDFTIKVKFLTMQIIQSRL